MIPERLLEKRLREGNVHTPRDPNVRVQVQKTFYFGSLHVNEILRDFYEGLAKAIFSGSLRNRKTEEGKEIEPDITNIERQRYIEVKAVGHTRRVMLKDEQIDKYAWLQISEEPISNPRIYFTLFRYGTRGIQKALAGKSEENALEYLTGDTKFMVGLPFSIVYCIHQAGLNNHPLTPRTYGEAGKPCTNLSTLILDSFFSHPEQTIRKFSLYPGHYSIKRRKLGEMLVNDVAVGTFPLVLIKDTPEHHDHWVAQLRQKLLNDVPF